MITSGMSVPSAFQLCAHLLDLVLVVGDVDRRHVRRDRAGVGQRLARHPVDRGHRHDHRVLDLVRIERRLRGQLAGGPRVVAVDGAEHHDQERDQEHHDPGAAW